MSGLIVKKFWHLGNYRYIFYRFVVEKFCENSLKKPCILLDAGCGSRISSLSNVPNNITVIGLDISRKNIIESYRKAKEKHYENFNFIVASITSLPIRNRIFHIVICVDVLEHIPNNTKAIFEISHILKPKAVFIGSTSNLINPLMFFDSFAPSRINKILVKKYSGNHYERHSRFSLGKLIQALNRANFKVYAIKLLGFPPFQPWLYEFSPKKIPWFAYIWITFNRITSKKPLNILRETIVFQAIKIVKSAS